MLNKIESLISMVSNANKKQIEKELIRPIYKGIPIYYNSLNIYCGNQGSGKTYSCCSDIVKICATADDFHMLIYITKSGKANDLTFETIKPLINIPIVYCNEDKAVEVVKNVMDQKELYHQIKDNHFENDIEDDQIEEIKAALKIDNFDHESLNTLIMFEDAANSPLLKNPSSYFSNLLTRLRHVRATVFILVQNWKTLNTTVKSQTNSIFIYKGYSKQQLHYILGQLPVGMDFNDVWGAYASLPKYGKMYVNAQNGLVKFICPHDQNDDWS